MRGNSNAALRGDPIQRLADGPMAPEPEVLEHPVVRAAAGIAAGLLLPQAATVEEAGVPPSHLRALANGGLVDLLDQPIAVQRVVAELLGGACGSTWFVWAQHQGVLRTVAASDGRFRAELLDGLRAGEPWGSLAYSHLRRPWALQVTLASQADGTSRVSGSLDWVTGWGLATLLLIAAVEEHGTRQEVHWVAFPADRLGELNPGRELRTLAMSGSRTRPVLLPDLHLTPMDVVTSMPMGAWRAEDAIRAATPNPAAFGLMRSVLTDLTEWAGSSDRDALPTILALAREAEELRRTAYDLVDATTADPAATGASGAMTADGEPAEHVVARRLELRGRQLALLQRVAALNVAVGGGAAVTMGTTAERWLREAAFHMVQGQTAALRRALVTGLGTSPSA